MSPQNDLVLYSYTLIMLNLRELSFFFARICIKLFIYFKYGLTLFYIVWGKWFNHQRFQADLKSQWKCVKNGAKSSNSNINVLLNVVGAECVKHSPQLSELVDL